MQSVASQRHKTPFTFHHLLLFLFLLLFILFASVSSAGVFTNKSATISGATDGSYRLTWAKSSGDFSQYFSVMETRPNGSRSQVYAGTVLNKYFSGKAPGTYKYELQSLVYYGSYGFVPDIRFVKTDTLTLVVKPPVPPTPSYLAVPTSTVTNGRIVISWAAASTASKYQLQERKNSGSWVTLTSSTTSRSYTRTGRSNGSYYYRVRGYNSSGWGGFRYSSKVTVLLPPPTPSSVSVPTSTVTNGRIVISWAAASTASKYQLQERKNSGSWVTLTSSTTSRSYTRTGRSNGSYYYRVRGYNSSGWGGFRYSAKATVLLPPPTPSSVSVPTSTVTNGRIVISWAAASTATKYQLQERKNSGSWVTLISSTTSRSYTRTGRSNGSYQYRVRAYNSSGWSGFRSSTSVNVFLVPTAPSSISVPTSTVTNGSIAISWPASSTATRYQLQERKNSGSWVTLASYTPYRSYTRSGRTNGSYQYRVKAYNSSGWGGYRYSSTVTVLLPPPAPSSVAVPTSTVTNGSIAISWPAVSTATKYQLQERQNSGSWVTLTHSLTTNSYIRTGRINSNYQYRIRACNSSGCSAYVSSTPLLVLLAPCTQTAAHYRLMWDGTAEYYKLQAFVNEQWLRVDDNVQGNSYIVNADYGKTFRISACTGATCGSWQAISNIQNNNLRINRFSTSGNGVASNEKISLSWQVDSAVTIDITSDQGHHFSTKEQQGQHAFTVDKLTEFTLTASNFGQTCRQSYRQSMMVTPPAIRADFRITPTEDSYLQPLLAHVKRENENMQPIERGLVSWVLADGSKLNIVPQHDNKLSRVSDIGVVQWTTTLGGIVANQPVLTTDDNGTRGYVLFTVANVGGYGQLCRIKTDGTGKQCFDSEPDTDKPLPALIGAPVLVGERVFSISATGHLYETSTNFSADSLRYHGQIPLAQADAIVTSPAFDSRGNKLIIRTKANQVLAVSLPEAPSIANALLQQAKSFFGFTESTRTATEPITIEWTTSLTPPLAATSLNTKPLNKQGEQ